MTGKGLRQLTTVSLFVIIVILGTACGEGDPLQNVPDEQGGQSRATAGLPPLPNEIGAKGKLIVGTKCDYPPFGYLDEEGGNVGFEPELARAFARMAFGSENAVEFQCVTSGNRVAFLQSRRVDLLIATVSYSPERIEIVDFSNPYYASGGIMLVSKDSNLDSPYDLKGTTPITFSGTTYDQWFDKCMPDLNPLYVDTTSQGMSALNAGRGPAFVQDDTVLSFIASENPEYKVAGPLFATTPWGMNVRKGEDQLRHWANAAISKLVDSGQMAEMFEETVPGEQKVGIDLAQFLPQPDKPLEYPKSSAEIYECDLSER